MVRKHIKIFVAMFLLSMFSVGCTPEATSDQEAIASISVNIKSTYQETFEELELGLIFDFNLTLLRADESWVKLWVEAYSEGEKVEPALSVLEYGESMDKEQEGNIGVGIINADSAERQLFLYGPSVRISPHTIDQDIFLTEGISNWDYAMDNKPVKLAPGEERTLAVYRQSAGNMNAYSYEEEESIEKMIQEDAVVILLKIRVDEQLAE